MRMKIIARIETDFGSKFGVPRQSGMVPDLRGRVVFEKEYRVAEAVRGLEDFDYVWLLWDFSEAHREQWSPTVRPPRLGGNERVGVFATRSPFRPNSIGLSSVRLLGIDYDAKDGPALLVGGADLMDGTPIYDIKPYLPYTDAHPEARAGFTLGNANAEGEWLEVEIPDALADRLGPEKTAALRGVLAADPRPRYQDDEERIYGLSFAGEDIHFRVEGRLLQVLNDLKDPKDLKK
ncbi:MAG: tRNA (N6-threonylcarbamoyladenosine(37)-N6)-methyltransferase TrmO [Bacteroidaceae bacterium]|nr:tRNA (N6-threonylcarbamoyladenosine(37)-N6)-methyltransferase TrmO [Bacteroidaceae bacterium]